ncbi:MAG: TIGR03862 family flavoprotein [Rhodobacteraceae bacterium]|nr:TIGR03862 family flavoprotein [Paracoccaceae bacterium]
MSSASALVIGAGPAGLMAAEQLARSGFDVTVAEAKPNVGRKFLMAGKSGLNLTKNEPLKVLMAAYAEATPWLQPMIKAFDAQAIQDWAGTLDQEVFTGSTGRVFPKAMKASPLLRAWLGRLNELGVRFSTRWRWTGWNDGVARFDTPDDSREITADVTVLALGGASWGRLGSDGEWYGILAAQGVDLATFAPANAGVQVQWSSHMAQALGQPLKNVAFTAGAYVSRGEAIISKQGLEGGGIYSISRGIREGHALCVDLFPDLSIEQLITRLARPRGKTSWSNHLRKVLKPGAARMALLNEFGRPLPSDPAALAALIKALPIAHGGLAPLDQAISTAGGVARSALDDDLMLTALPGVFCAGEMLNWEAPTGGYLLTACLASGRWAGQAAVRYLHEKHP